jgi:hypothetical protein
LQWEVSLRACEALSERAKTGGRGCGPCSSQNGCGAPWKHNPSLFIQLLSRLVFEDSEPVRYVRNIQRNAGINSLWSMFVGAIPTQRVSSTRHSTRQCRSFHKIQVSECLHVRKKLWKRWVLQDMACDYGLRDDTIYALGNYRW